MPHTSTPVPVTWTPELEDVGCEHSEDGIERFPARA